MKLETLQDGIIHLKFLKNHPKHDNSYVIIKEPIVNKTVRESCNEDYCREHNIEITSLARPGGTFVFGPNDFVCMHVEKKDNFGIKWKDFLKTKLQERGLTALKDNNDLLIDGYKFLGDAKIEAKQDYIIYVCCISICDQKETIEKICETQRKPPRGLSKYGISADVIEKWYLEFIFLFN